MPFTNISRLSISSVSAPQISERISEESTRGCIAARYTRLSILLQSMHFRKFFFKTKSSHSRILLPFPSIKGCAIFIFTYFLVIPSIESSGISSMSVRFSFRYMDGANTNPPFAILQPRIYPAKSYRPPKINLWICCNLSSFPLQFRQSSRFQIIRSLLFALFVNGTSNSLHPFWEVLLILCGDKRRNQSNALFVHNVGEIRLSVVCL